MDRGVELVRAAIDESGGRCGCGGQRVEVARVAMVGGVVQSDRGCQGVGVVGLVILVKGLG